MAELSEACRHDPLGHSKFRVVCATEIPWLDPSEAEDASEKASRQRQFDSLHAVISKLPRDLVLIISTDHDNPLTKNDLAQSIITKGYWVVLKQVDVSTAMAFLENMTGWEEELRLEVIESVGTSVGELLAFIRLIRLAYQDPTEEEIREFLTGYIRGTVFDLTDAIAMKDLEQALALARDDLPLGQLIGSIDRKLTTLVQFMAEMRRGRSPKEAALMLRMPGFIVHGLYEASKRWNTSEILMMFPTLAEYSATGDRPGAAELMIHDLVG
jgi:DNA polymerase III delta subunit